MRKNCKFGSVYLTSKERKNMIIEGLDLNQSQTCDVLHESSQTHVNFTLDRWKYILTL